MSIKKPWKDIRTHLTPSSIEHNVRPNLKLNFYPLSVGQLTELRTLAEPLADAIVTFLTPSENDVGQSSEQIDDKKEQVATFRSIREATPLSVIQHREAQKRAAMSKLVMMLLDEKTTFVVGGLIMDSLRDTFTREEANSPKAIEAFVKGTDTEPGLDAEMIVSFMIGVAKANAEVFGPLGLNAARDLVSKRLSTLSSNQNATATNGDNSPTPSSSPSPEDTVLSTS